MSPKGSKPSEDGKQDASRKRTRGAQAKDTPKPKKLRNEFTEEEVATVLGFTDKMGDPTNTAEDQGYHG